MEKLLTKKEAAALLDVSVSTLERIAARREIGYYMIGSRMRFEKSDVENYLQRVRTTPAPQIVEQVQPSRAKTPPAQTKKRGPGRPRKGIDDQPEYFPGMKVV